MSEPISTAAEPAYIAKLALSGLPYAPLKRRDEFYDSGQHGQTYKLLLHLLRSTTQNIVLQADEGLGKTTLLQLLASEECADLRFCRYDSSIAIDSLYAALGKTFSVQNTAFLSGASDLHALEQLLQTLKQRHIKPVLLIDDVEQADSEKLKRLVELSSKQYEGEPLLQVIICCHRYSPVIQQTFPNSHNIALTPLDLAEVRAYLMYRLQAVGYQGDSPFSDNDIRSLYKKSQGNIKQLNILAHQFLLRGKRASFSIKTPQFKLPVSLLKLLAGLVAVVFVITVLIFQDTINKWMSGQPAPVIEEAEPELDVNDDVVMVETDDVQTSSQTVKPEDELERLLAELEAEKAINNELKSLSVSEPHTVNKSVQTDILGEEWILAQSGVHYTFQLKGAWTRQEIEAYINQYNLSGEMAIFASLRNDKPWYVLVYGSYKNKTAAVQASKGWQAPLNTLPTWLRRFDSVQKQIKELGIKP